MLVVRAAATLSRCFAPVSARRPSLADLIIVLTQKEIKVRYKSTWLGYAWSVANPLAFALIYLVAFGIVMRVGIPDYPLFLVAGLFPWQWLANSVAASPRTFLADVSLIKKVSFPRNVLVAAVVLSDGIHFGFAIPIVAGFLLLYGLVPAWSWLAGVPLLMLGQFALIYGLSLTIASLNLFFRDLERLTGLLVTFLLFLTPVVYSDDMIPEGYRWLVYVNPVAPLILGWRRLFLSGELDWSLVGLVYCYALIATGVGSAVYRKLCWRFAEVV